MIGFTISQQTFFEVKKLNHHKYYRFLRKPLSVTFFYQEIYIFRKK